MAWERWMTGGHWITGVLLAAALLLPARAASAQAPGSPVGRPAPEAGGYLSLGLHRLDLEGLNGPLAAAGHGEASETMLVLGAGGFVRFHRLSLGGEGHVLLGPDAAAPARDFRTRVTGGYGLATVAYALIHGGRASLGPSLGIGVGGYRAAITGTDAVTFPELLDSPGRGTAVNHAVVLADAGLAATLRLLSGPGPGRGGLEIGVRMGYTIAPFPGAWRHNGKPLAGGPELGMDGAYIRITVGGWGTGSAGESREPSEGN